MMRNVILILTSPIRFIVGMVVGTSYVAWHTMAAIVMLPFNPDGLKELGFLDGCRSVYSDVFRWTLGRQKSLREYD